MKNRNSKLTCKQVRDFDLVDFLNGLGHHPVKIRNHEYWYLSPLRSERNASFKVNRKTNRWFDFQLWQGGDLIDFATTYHDCTISDFLQILNQGKILPCTHRVNYSEPPGTPPIRITKLQSISDQQLLNYLHRRRIPFHIAQKYCLQATFKLHEKSHLAIAFKNDLGGYELRSGSFKGSTRPKSLTTITSANSNCAAVFEGFFDLLTYKTIIPETNTEQDLIVLNGLGFIPQIKHTKLDLFLDRDDAGRKATLLLCSSSPEITDRSTLYKNHKDLNDFLCHFGNNPIDSDLEVPEF